MHPKPLFLCLALLSPGGSALAYVEALYPFEQVLNESTNVVVGKVELVDAERRVIVAQVARALKGNVEIARVKMMLGTAAADHAQYAISRVQPGDPYIHFYKRDGMNICSLAYFGDAWVQFYATDDPDKAKVWWRLSHVEIRMNRTFKGTTSDLIKLTEDCIAGRVKPPPPDPKVPPIDPSKPGPASIKRLEDPRDGLEAVPGWHPDDSWARPARLTIEESKERGKVLSAESNGAADKKLAVVIMLKVDLAGASRLAMDVDNGSERPLTVAVALGASPDWAMFETPPAIVPPKAKAAHVGFNLTDRKFKCQASNWEHNQPMPNNGSVDKIMLLVEGMPEKGTVAFDRIRATGGGFLRQFEFSHSPGVARGISWADVNGDDRLDAYLSCEQGDVLLANEGRAFRDVTAQFGLRIGSYSAAWADYNGDGHPDLLTNAFQLLTNVGARFQDDSKLLPAPPGRAARAAGWIDYNGDGLPDVLVANGDHGLCLYENTGKGPQWFRDVSEKVGLGPNGLGKGSGSSIVFADYDGDGYTDFLCNAGRGLLVHNEAGKGFALDTRAGIELPGGPDLPRGAVFADFDNDGDLDLFVPGPGKPKLYRNNNDGTFTDVIGAAGDLAKAAEPSVAAAWGDVNSDGCLDLFVCFASGPGRLYLGGGKGSFKDATVPAGLDKLGPAFAASFADADDDGDLDLMVNLDRKAVLAINEMDPDPRHAFLKVKVMASKGLIGATVRVADEKDKPLGLRQVAGVESGGAQASPIAHFGVPVGKCHVSVCLTDGRVAQKLLTIPASGANLALRDGDFK